MTSGLDSDPSLKGQALRQTEKTLWRKQVASESDCAAERAPPTAGAFLLERGMNAERVGLFFACIGRCQAALKGLTGID